MTWWPFILLALAAYRTWRLLADDTILDRPRAWVVRSERVSEFASCCWCLGFWVTLAWWASWELWPHGTLLAAAPMALAAIVGLVASHDGT